MSRASKFCGKKQIKTEGKKEHYVVQCTWDGETIVNSNNKNGCRTQHRRVHTDIIKILLVQCKGQYKDQCLPATTTNYSQ